jgi:hypothetical protein
MYLRGVISILVPALFSEIVAILTAPAVRMYMEIVSMGERSVASHKARTQLEKIYICFVVYFGYNFKYTLQSLLQLSGLQRDPGKVDLILQGQ